jgi:asparagine synthase (glutamine-hydrolysing)
MAADASVWFYGEGPDNALKFDREAYFAWLLRNGHWRRAARAAWHYLWIKTNERWREGSRQIVTGSDASSEPEIPAWLNADFVAHSGVRERARSQWGPLGDRHPWHPRAIASFAIASWQALFANFEADEAGAPLVWRHPYLDLRVLGFMLSVPPVPWARRKLVMTEAMAGRLPQELLARRKTPLAADPMRRALRGLTLPKLASMRELQRWLDPSRLPSSDSDPSQLEQLIAVHALDHWLEQNRPSLPPGR